MKRTIFSAQKRAAITSLAPDETGNTSHSRGQGMRMNTIVPGDCQSARADKHYERRNVMSRTLIAAVLCIAAIASLPLRADSPPAEGRKCTLATLQGTYLLTARLDAPSYAQVPGVPQVVGGLRTFDGAGNSSASATVNAGGVILQGVRSAGVYVLNADCTGTMFNDGTRHYDIYVAPDGSAVVGIRTDPGVVEIVKFKRVSPP